MYHDGYGGQGQHVCCLVVALRTHDTTDPQTTRHTPLCHAVASHFSPMGPCRTAGWKVIEASEVCRRLAVALRTHDTTRPADTTRHHPCILQARAGSCSGLMRRLMRCGACACRRPPAAAGPLPRGACCRPMGRRPQPSPSPSPSQCITRVRCDTCIKRVSRCVSQLRT